MQITAHLNSLRMAPRKVRLVAKILRGLDAVEAKNKLRYITKAPSKSFSKLLDSALANARNNSNLVESNLRIKDIVVNGGAVLKRFKPKGFGSASPITKRTSHVTLILEEKVPGLRSEKKKVEPKAEQASEAKPRTEPRSGSGTGVQKEIGQKGSGIKNLARRFFRRKSI